ncbi:hypothetical protein [Bradyrhizobium niftali]|uniref:Uncharacterized protein n=1 Tax=Bradyrhizobium niftali TaxID=2560055 RepID=A0A4Y9L005_9BRAD|nr:hypothetical protein [Bradyrhizobium niftali]TFV36938.1 hypothetical protein E4K65_44460 [Bradyrhizobium niftali]
MSSLWDSFILQGNGQQRIAIATAAFAIGLFCWFGGNYVVAEERLHKNAEIVVDLLKEGPATYDDILKKDLGFAATDQAISYLAENGRIIPKTEDNVVLHGKEQSDQLFGGERTYHSED